MLTLAPNDRDDTDALIAMFAEMRSDNEPAMLKGNYRLREGELSWMADTFRKYTPGPVLHTMPGTTFSALGIKDGPLLTIGSSKQSTYIQGGHIGDLNFRDLSPFRDKVTARHAISLSSTEKMSFGNLYADGIKGDLINIPDKTDDGFSGDWTHVFDCSFRAIESVRSTGWALNNESPNQTFNACEIGVIRSMACDHGAWRNCGAGNKCRIIDVGHCRGWALDFSRNTGTTTRLIIDMMELDSPEYGIHLSCNMQSYLGLIRFNHRVAEVYPQYGDPLAWPKVCFKIGGEGPWTKNVHADITHRLGPHTNPLDDKTLGTFVDFSDEKYIHNVDIVQDFLDAHTPPLTIRPFVNLHPEAEYIYMNGVKVQ